MSHGIYRIEAVERVGTYLLRLHFDDGTARTIDFEPLLAGSCSGGCGIPICSPRFPWTRRFTPLSGQPERISTRRRSTTGRSTSRLFEQRPSIGASAMPWPRTRRGSLTWDRGFIASGRHWPGVAALNVRRLCAYAHRRKAQSEVQAVRSRQRL